MILINRMVTHIHSAISLFVKQVLDDVRRMHILDVFIRLISPRLIFFLSFFFFLLACIPSQNKR